MKKTLILRACRVLTALTLALAMTFCAPANARAGFLDWLFGRDDAVEAAAPVELPTAAATPARAGTPEPTETPEPTRAPIPDAALTDDGLLRVYLKSLGDPAGLTLTFAGIYAVGGDPGFRFDRNARVGLAAADGQIYLTAGGLTLNLGASVTFTRHAAAEGAENGIYIDGSEKGNLYCGDLTVTARGGALEPVLELPVEDYLYGVVAYEMSDSFPIEALKAQAVAARTYAMQRKWSAGDRAYHLVDTTADQVFKGYDPRYANVIAAVDATRGVAGIVGEGFARCYYTASNGGQTALPGQVWSDGEGDAYLAMTDDPYDLENPRSLQNTVTVAPDCDGSAALKAMLEKALAAPMTFMGYAAGEWRMDAIEAITPVSPVARGSRQFRKLDFDVRVQVLVPVAAAASTAEPAPDGDGRSPASTAEPGPDGDGWSPAPTAEPERAWTALDRPVTVTLDVFDQIKDGLKLGLNKADYELLAVETETNDAGAPTAFTLVMRRYGHGVGMSQRGAQWMAGHYGMDWRDILAFYYPGVSFQRMAWPEAVLTDLAALPASVAHVGPTPEPAPLPTPGPGEYVALVVLEQADSTLNVRESPSLDARVLATLTDGREVIVAGDADAQGWVAIRTAEFSGYVKQDYLGTPID